MLINKNFIPEVADKLLIFQEVDETQEQWYMRVLYSLTGGHIISSLYEYEEENPLNDNTVSIQHVIKRGNDFLTSLNIQKFDCDMLCKLFIKTGCILHKNNRLSYPKKTEAKNDNILFTRGVPLWTNMYVSGIGTYSIYKNESSPNSLYEMFGMVQYDNIKWFELFLKNINWQTVNKLPENVEYLNINELAHKGYWQSKPPKKGLSICRTKTDEFKIYYIINISDVIDQSIIPECYSEHGEYIRLAIALRTLNDNKPHVKIILKKYTVELELNYLLPPAEQNFLELYSWDTERKDKWHRIISIKLYPVFKKNFESFNFIIDEEQYDGKCKNNT